MTNSTLDDNLIMFPLDRHPLYVDATHEVTIINSESTFSIRSFYMTTLVLTAHNLMTLAATGLLLYDHIPETRLLVATFATDIQFQCELILMVNWPQLSCILVLFCFSGSGLICKRYKYCMDNSKYRDCSVDGFVRSSEELIQETNFVIHCPTLMPSQSWSWLG